MKLFRLLILGTLALAGAFLRADGPTLDPLHFEFSHDGKRYACASLIVDGDQPQARLGPVMFYPASLLPKHHVSVRTKGSSTTGSSGTTVNLRAGKIWYVVVDHVAFRVDVPGAYVVEDEMGSLVVRQIQWRLPEGKDGQFSREVLIRLLTQAVPAQ